VYLCVSIISIPGTTYTYIYIFKELTRNLMLRFTDLTARGGGGGRNIVVRNAGRHGGGGLGGGGGAGGMEKGGGKKFHIFDF